MAESLAHFGQPGREDDATVVSLGNVALNLANYRVTVAGERVDFTYHEFDLLRLLAVQADRIVAFPTLSQALWGSVGHKENRRLHVLAYRLRNKLAGSSPYHIETVHRRGYGLVQDAKPGEQHAAS